MSEWWAAIASSVVTLAIIGVMALVFQPVRRRVEPTVMRVAKDHGLKLVVFATAGELRGMLPDEILNLRPGYIGGTHFYFPNGAPSERPPKEESLWWAWAANQGGEDVGYSHILLLLQATQDRTVTVLPPRIQQRVSIISGGTVCSPEPRPVGNGLMARQFQVNLDTDKPVAKFFDITTEQIPVFKMNKGDSEAFLVIARTAQDRHEWRVNLPVIVDGEEVVLSADHHGMPFVTIGPVGLTRLHWTDRGRGRWSRVANGVADLED